MKWTVLWVAVLGAAMVGLGQRRQTARPARGSTASGGSSVGPGEGRPLTVLTGGYPRAFFFRSAEGWAANRRIDYGRWEATFGRLSGVEGKVLDEEVIGRHARNVEFFTRLKRAHPDQLVLLHYNGNARDPRWRAKEFFAGHWIYRPAVKILADVPAEQGVSEIRVADTASFRTGIGRYRTSNDDIGLCELDAAGRPDWHRCEQVQLVSVDAKRGTIRIRRGCYGTEPRAFKVGRSAAAAHVTEGPWGRRNHLMWFHNYSTRCPRDATGRTCSDVLSAELGRLLGPGGELAAFDGVEFDVLMFAHGGRGRGGIDCDGDGVADNGVFDGVNTYGLGVVEFARTLRKLLPNKLLLADGHADRHQRCFGIFNGIESEGWPALRDVKIRDWSGGLNRHAFWSRRGAGPVFNYVNHKFNEPGGAPGVVRRPQTPFSTHRLVFAGAVFTDSAICYAFAPPKPPDELIGVWDELWAGRDRRVGWLGKPLAPAVHLARRRKDLLDGLGARIDERLLKRLEGEGVRFALDGGQLKVTAASADAKRIRFRLIGVPRGGPDLFVSMTARGAAMRGYPKEVARLTHVGIAADEGLLIRPEPPAAGMCLRGAAEAPLEADTGAAIRYMPRQSLGGRARAAYFAHPPYRGGPTGYVFWTRDVTVPPGGRLELHTGMGEKSPARSDGVVFRVLAAELTNGKPGRFDKLLEHTQKASEWTAHKVSLADRTGRRIRLKFVADAGAKDNATTDHAHWADVCVVGPDGRAGLNQARRFMTWTDGRPFESSFYFDAVQGRPVDLEFNFEGAQPIWISRLTAHAGADAMVRLFEGGLVLANPSPRPYTFDLRTIAGGRELRRLAATALQDTKTNNGAPAAGKLTLGPKDALFLVNQR